MPTLNLHCVLVDVTNVQHYKMRAALKLLYNNIYAKLDGCALQVQYLFKDLTGLYHPKYLTTLYFGYECVSVSVAKERIKRKLPTGFITVRY